MPYWLCRLNSFFVHFKYSQNAFQNSRKASIITITLFIIFLYSFYFYTPGLYGLINNTSMIAIAGDGNNTLYILSLPNIEINSGSRFDADVLINNAAGLEAWNLQLEYNPGILKFLDVKPAAITDPSKVWIFANESTYSSTRSCVTIGCIIYNMNYSSSGSGALFTFEFEALQAGFSNLELSIEEDPGNNFSQNETAINQGSVNVRSSNQEFSILLQPGFNLIHFPVSIGSPVLFSYDLITDQIMRTVIKDIRCFDKATDLYQITYWDQNNPAGTNFPILNDKAYMFYSYGYLNFPLTMPQISAYFIPEPGIDFIGRPSLQPKPSFYSALSSNSEGRIKSIEQYDSPEGKWKMAYLFFGLPAGKEILVKPLEGYRISLG